MKKWLFAIVFITSACPAFCQIPKGTSTIGGSISASYQESKPQNGGTDKTTSFSLIPGYGFFIVNNLCVGADVGLSINRSKEGEKVNGQELNNNTRATSAGPFVRYYVPIHPKLYAFAHAGYTWQWNKQEYENWDYYSATIFSSEVKYKSQTWSLGLGLSYFLTPHAALEATLGYTHLKIPSAVDNSVYTSSEKTGTTSLSIGFRVFLRKKN